MRFVFLVFVQALQGDNFLDCCEKADYNVTVGGVTCPIGEVIRKKLSCAPNQQILPDSDVGGGSRVMVISDLSPSSLFSFTF